MSVEPPRAPDLAPQRERPRELEVVPQIPFKVCSRRKKVKPLIDPPSGWRRDLVRR